MAKKAKPPEPVADGAKRSMKISDMTMARARFRPTRRNEQPPVANPFAPAQHPPRATPSGRLKSHQMAMDDSLNANVAWAGNFYGAAFTEGTTFLGYTYLAELTQRPEYRVISETIATEATRKWIKIQTSGEDDKSEKIKVIEAEFERLNVRDVFRNAIEQDGFFGRAHVYIDTGATDDPQELKTPIGDGQNRITKSKIKRNSLKRLSTVEAVWVYPTNYNSNDPLKPDWYKPSSWFVMGKQLHSSRLLTIIGREVPDLLKPAYSFGGLALSQMVKPYVDNWLETRQAVNDLIQSFSVSGIKTNIQESLMGDGDQMFRRADLFNATRNNRGLMLLDKDTEEFFNVTTPLGTLDALQAQAQEHMCSVSRIPTIKLLGIQPAGLNASSEGEIRTFYDSVNSFQEKVIREPLTRVLGFVQMSKFGEVDPDITFAFEELWSLDDLGRANVQKVEAETDTIHIDNGTVSPEEARARIAHDPETPYKGLSPEDMPEPEPDDEDSDILPGGGIGENLNKAPINAKTENDFQEPSQ